MVILQKPTEHCKAIKRQLKIKQNSGKINLERLNWLFNPCITIRDGVADTNKTPFAIKKKKENSGEIRYCKEELNYQ